MYSHVIGPVMKIYRIDLESDSPYTHSFDHSVLVVAEDITNAVKIVKIPSGEHIAGVGLIGEVEAIQEREQNKEPQYDTMWATVDEKGKVTTGTGQNPAPPVYVTNVTNTISDLEQMQKMVL